MVDEARAATTTTPWPIRLVRWPANLIRTLVRVIPQAIDGFFADRCGQHAAGIAYRVLFSLVPLSIVLVAVFGIVLQNDGLRNDVVREIVDALPLSSSGGAKMTNAIEDLASPATALGLFSLLLFGWAATGMMAALRAGLEVAMRVDRGRPAVRGKLVDFILIVGAGALVLGVVLINLATQIAFDRLRRPLDWLGVDGGVIEETIRNGAPFLLTVVVVLLLYRFVPARSLRLGDAFAGAIFTAVVFFGISLVSSVIFERTRSLSFIYGSLTQVLVSVYSIYLYASALLLGAEVAAAWSRPSDDTGEPLSQQIRRVALGLFVYQEPPGKPARRPRVPTDPR